MNNTSSKSIGQKFLAFSGVVLAGSIGLAMALQILSQIWGWIALVAVIAGLGIAGWRLSRKFADRW